MSRAFIIRDEEGQRFAGAPARSCSCPAWMQPLPGRPSVPVQATRHIQGTYRATGVYGSPTLSAAILFWGLELEKRLWISNYVYPLLLVYIYLPASGEVCIKGYNRPHYHKAPRGRPPAHSNCTTLHIWSWSVSLIFRHGLQVYYILRWHLLVNSGGTILSLWYMLIWISVAITKGRHEQGQVLCPIGVMVLSNDQLQ